MAGELPETATDADKEAHGKLLKKLSRYNTPAEVAKALRAAEVRISSGELKAVLPKNATPEQVAEWRKENGIPEAPDKYDLTLPDGMKVEADDQPLVDAFVKDMHGLNATPEMVKGAVTSFMRMRGAQIEKIVQMDADTKAAAEDDLRAEWGEDYRTNVAGIDAMLGQADSSVKEAILRARDPSGAALANNPAVLKWLAAHARELGYVGATVVPAGGDLGKTIDDELGDLKKQMGTDEWAKNAKGQARYMQLIDAKKRLDARK